ncbi:TonB-dependent receptor [Microbulbifer thermotolerans]|uniref:TonB-dependent receptor n=1 Tax=Microbulbifer thermotolerans TaxID=252514 RepID=UPI00224A5FBD|nr:TonB-dependent receptor [Microbulbifer thermotolerans]MCX2833491.1 TonB-dependent receptor [Microbulbifer thermotolerans]
MKKNIKINKQRLMRDISMLMLTASSVTLIPSVTAQENAPMEEVIAVGIRHSLEAAVDAKRNEDRIVDAVVAEDIGKLPDNNVAEALQRVTGVSINRDFGVGSEVSIRGLKQNRVEINGRSTLGDGRNGINFQDFPADFLSKVEVIKSPTPEMIEGALGGTISLVTARPLDLNAPLATVSIQGEYADKADHWAPIFNTSFGDSWDLGSAGTFGAMASISYQDRTLSRDESLLQLAVGPVDFNNDGVIDDADAASNTPSGNYVYGREHTYNPHTERRERTAFNVALQWAPASGQGMFYVDLNATERSGDQEAFSILHIGGTPVTIPGETYEDSDGQLQNFLYEEVLPIQTSASNFRNTDSYSHAFGGEWNFTENLKISAEFATAESDTYEPKSEFRFRGIDQSLEGDGHIDANEWYVPVIFENSSSSAPVVDFTDGYVFTNQQNQAFRRYEDTRTYITNQEDAFRLDFEYTEPFDLEWVSAVKTGFRFTERDFEQNQRQFRLTNIYKNLLDSEGNPDIIWMEDIAALFPSAITTYHFNDAFEHTGTRGAYELAAISAFDVGLLQDQEATFNIVKQLLEGTNYAIEGDLDDNLEYMESGFSAITEETSAFYLQANLDFGDVRAIIGGRYVKTDIESSAYQNVDGLYEIVTDGTSYDDFLPSVNVTWNLSEDTLLRFAAGKVMRRADFNELSPAYQFRDAYIAADRGNPELEPYRATQYDISAEHYWGEGNMLSAAVFYKDVASFLKTTSECANLPEIVRTLSNTDDYEKICLWNVDGPIQYADADTPIEEMGIETDFVTNGEQGKVQGFELGYQQSFDFLPGFWSGLGLSANYTYSDSEDPDGVPLEDISKDTFNAQLYYEYEGLGIRLAYTFRDRFLDNNDTKRVRPLGVSVGADPEDPTLGNDYREDLQQLDLSATYDIGDHITLVAHITNLTAEPTINTGANGTVFQIMETDRRYAFGLRARF